ncbi:hypothetical protein ABZ330_32820 [Streptomyces sp. NPDC006172]|uniref:hypothetical protein n=1 Tax=Streptomyces sp. NPDC006172 TaxID=3154470 RepID=UPI0034119BF8
MDTARRLPRSRRWLRVLVLLLAVVVPGASAEAAALPALSAAVVEIAEYDGLDAAPRAPAGGAHRAVAPALPSPRPARTPTAPPSRLMPPSSCPPYALGVADVLRTVVLRC